MPYRKLDDSRPLNFCHNRIEHEKKRKKREKERKKRRKRKTYNKNSVQSKYRALHISERAEELICYGQ
jgi:hypothetical protein